VGHVLQSRVFVLKFIKSPSYKLPTP
jgi:hypothetical protein